MKKYILLIIALFINLSAFATTSETSNNGGTILSGLSIALLVMLGLIFYMSYEKSKLHKENARLHKELQELKKKK